MTDPDYHHQIETNPSAAVRQFIKAIAAAHSIILTSPLYQGSYLGVLKNTLDNLTHNAFLNKPVGLIPHGITTKRCAQPCEHLLPVMRTLYGYALQCHVAFSNEDFSSNDEGRTWKVISKEIQIHCERLADEMCTFLQQRESV
ncbi:NADPH-dependent FMN reductase [Bartonella queenslandensis]|uniref:NADPH-dependent FMN reductase n=1 Tax=Bartonella queenslandensis TaxID=481138 RepID=UPI0003190CCD|nr:NAD(P)H-dependent oxidoreductase [Bartonella queenslandensis]